GSRSIEPARANDVSHARRRPQPGFASSRTGNDAAGNGFRRRGRPSSPAHLRAAAALPSGPRPDQRFTAAGAAAAGAYAWASGTTGSGPRATQADARARAPAPARPAAADLDARPDH